MEEGEEMDKIIRTADKKNDKEKEVNTKKEENQIRRNWKLYNSRE